MNSKRKIGIFTFQLLLLFAWAMKVSAKVEDLEGLVPVALLIEDSSKYDGKSVTVEGELIGDIMTRGSHVWLCLLDDGTAVGVWAEKDKLPTISFVGAYGVRGDTIRIKGILHRACPEHGGDFDIHAELVDIIKRGEALVHPVHTSRIVMAIALGVVGLTLVSLWRRRERGMGKARNVH